MLFKKKLVGGFFRSLLTFVRFAAETKQIIGLVVAAKTRFLIDKQPSRKKSASKQRVRPIKKVSDRVNFGRVTVLFLRKKPPRNNPERRHFSGLVFSSLAWQQLRAPSSALVSPSIQPRHFFIQ